MAKLTPAAESVLRLSPRIEVLPILHGSGDMAQEVRETLISRPFDCLAVPLPPSVESAIEAGVAALPQISLVVLPEPDQSDQPTASIIPVDPCQAVIMGIRGAMGEQIARAYIDRDVTVFEPAPMAAPDAYALRRVSLAAFASALLPSLPPPAERSQRWDRVNWMAFRLHALELEYESILFLCPLMDWPWLREAYRDRKPYRDPDPIADLPTVYAVHPGSLYFMLGELPFITELYERRRAELRSDSHLSIDGIKELLLETRARWLARRSHDGQTVHNWVTPQLLQLYLQYVRNLALMAYRLTPDLYTLVLAAKQMAGDDFAIMLLETAKSYGLQPERTGAAPPIAAGIDRIALPDGEIANTKNRLQGPPLTWRSLSLKPQPTRQTSRRWALRWNPFRQCSWPPEDDRIESFTRHVREQARAILGADLARVEKFTTSVKDGVDVRESLRHWRETTPPAIGSRAGHKSNPTQIVIKPEIYVKDIPPARGHVEAVVFLFETPADPRRYSWQATWYAEHEEESTLCFYATPFLETMVGPGIGQATYGGALFLFPPRPIPNVWEDQSLSFTQSLEERLIAAAAVHSRESHLALVSPIPPRMRWRRIVRQAGRRLITIPLSRFSGQTIERLRRFHVLNGHEIRSYAAQFIRE